jgi:nucleotide-binding universal stress UspA family protein
MSIKPLTPYLRVDRLVVNTELARRLPSDVACRFHALPIAEDNGRITVAMADPRDNDARVAVVAALGESSCVVGCERGVIDALLADLWPTAPSEPRQFLVCAPEGSTFETVSTFARELGALLGAHVSYYKPVGGGEIDCAALGELAGQSRYDLVVWSEPGRSLGKRLICGPVFHKAIKKIDSSLLLVRCPHWPLRRLLLVVRGEAFDDAAAVWALHLAAASAAAVTILVVLPAVPAMYGGCAAMQHRLDALLTTDTELGRQVRRITDRLSDGGVEGTLRLRQGALDGEICREMTEGDHDLIVVAARPAQRAARWLIGDRLLSLLCWADKPLLIAKPKTK